MTSGREQTAGRQPWHKPVIYELTHYLDTSGGPMAKVQPFAPSREDENRPAPQGRYKTYQPVT